MIMDPMFILIFALLGAFGGFAAGLLGVGGGMVLVPFLNYLLPMLGVPALTAVHAAIATAMATILFTSISSMRAHHGRGGVRWDLVKLLAPGVVVGGLLSGGAIFAIINGLALAVFFVGFVFYSAIKMLRDVPPPEGRGVPGPWIVRGVGVAIGLISGLLGAGGGFLSVPFLVRSNVIMPVAVGTSAALGFFIAVANGVGYMISGAKYTDLSNGMLGYVYWPALLVLVVMSMIMAPIGARVAHRMPVRRLKRVFAVVLLVLAVMMLVDTLQMYL